MAQRTTSATLGVIMSSILEAKEQAKKISKVKKVKLKEALLIIAKENDFPDWKSYKNSLDTFWYQKSSPFLNHWFAKHVEAKDFQKLNGGYLLTYKGQYFVASKDYIEHLGLDPLDTVWKAINYDVSSANAIDKFHNYYQNSLGEGDE